MFSNSLSSVKHTLNLWCHSPVHLPDLQKVLDTGGSRKFQCISSKSLQVRMNHTAHDHETNKIFLVIRLWRCFLKRSPPKARSVHIMTCFFDSAISTWDRKSKRWMLLQLFAVKMNNRSTPRLTRCYSSSYSRARLVHERSSLTTAPCADSGIPQRNINEIKNEGWSLQEKAVRLRYNYKVTKKLGYLWLSLEFRVNNQLWLSSTNFFPCSGRPVFLHRKPSCGPELLRSTHQDAREHIWSRVAKDSRSLGYLDVDERANGSCGRCKTWWAYD